MITYSSFFKADLFTYQEFVEFVEKLFIQGLATGHEQNEERIEATRLNLHRLKRIQKQLVLLPEVAQSINQLKSEQNWFLILEGWCGDGAQIAPVINAIAATSEYINLRVLLRDDNPEIMDSFLTNGTRSIPKLICFRKNDKHVKGTWGPRPVKIIEAMNLFKKEHPNADKNFFKNHLHLVYSQDKTKATQEELARKIMEWR